MIKKSELLQFYDTLLDVKSFKDFGPNGLQVDTENEEINKISFAVTATVDSISKAHLSDALVVHHGLFWNYQGPMTITDNHGKRITALIKKEMSLLAYHLPLDANIKIGNAAVLANTIGIYDLKPFGDYKGSFTGVKGYFPNQITAGMLADILSEKLNRDIIVSTDDMRKPINSISIITGAAQHDWKLAKDEGLDAFITGEINHHCWTDSRESDLPLFSCGHEATEELGIKALMQATKAEFGDNIEVEFIKSKNPV